MFYDQVIGVEEPGGHHRSSALFEEHSSGDNEDSVDTGEVNDRIFSS